MRLGEGAGIRTQDRRIKSSNWHCPGVSMGVQIWRKYARNENRRMSLDVPRQWQRVEFGSALAAHCAIGKDSLGRQMHLLRMILFLVGWSMAACAAETRTAENRNHDQR